MTATLTAEQVGRVRRFVVEEVASTAAGRDWLERLRPVALELVALYSGLPRVRDRVDTAVARAARLVESPRPRIEHDDVRAFESALSTVHAAAGPELRSLTRAVADELHQAAGKPLREVLA
jgi:hypothetical protein